MTWYQTVDGADLEQGDIIEACSIFVPPADLTEADQQAEFTAKLTNLIVLTQSCDLVSRNGGRAKVETVILAAMFTLEELAEANPQFKGKALDRVRDGNQPPLCMLAESSLKGLIRPIRVINFHQVHTLPLDFLRRRAATAGPRLRLLAPYREHVSQSFARFLMRVGLPIEIPKFG